MNAVESLLRGHIRESREKIAEAASRVDALEQLVDRMIKSKPAEPQRRDHAPQVDGWSPDEDKVVRENYELLGSRGCVELLPHRSEAAIRTHASKLGITRMPSAERFFCEQCDASVNSAQIASCRSKFCKGKALVAGQE